MHGVRQLDPAATGRQHPAGAGGPGGGRDPNAAMPNAILRSAGIRRRDMVTHAQPSGRLEVADGEAPVRLDFDRGAADDGAALSAPPRAAAPGGAPPGSMYVPAGRAGTIQSLLAVLQAKDMFNSAPDGAGGTGPGRAPGGAPQLRLAGQIPEHLGQFYGAVIGALSGGLGEDARGAFSGGLGEDARGAFSGVFGGSLAVSAAGGPAALLYRDQSGFEAEIGLAGSGVLSALPVVAALHGVRPGGALAVEEPEAGIEPLVQLRFAKGIVRAALSRRVDLVLATHSDYVVNGVLNMVHDGIIGPDDLGLYYFRRRKGAFTRVERIAVDVTGEAEQELFEEALDALAKGESGGGP